VTVCPKAAVVKIQNVKIIARQKFDRFINAMSS
jgi:hypothetical protein